MSMATVTYLYPERERSSRSQAPSLRAGRAGQGPLRLTRRGRLFAAMAVLGFALLLIVGGVLGLQRVAGASDVPPAPAAPTYHVVLPGETLWGIAAREFPQADRRATIARIIELNALPDGRVYAGQRIAIEAG